MGGRCFINTGNLAPQPSTSSGLEPFDNAHDLEFIERPVERGAFWDLAMKKRIAVSIACLLAFLVPAGCIERYVECVDTASETAAQAALAVIRIAATQYYTANGKYPEDLEAMGTFLTDPALKAGSKNKYDFEYSLTGDGWECYAIPSNEHSTARALYVSNDNVIRRGKSGRDETDGPDWPPIR